MVMRGSQAGPQTVMDDSLTEPQPQAFDAPVVQPMGASRNPATSQAERASQVKDPMTVYANSGRPPDSSGAAGATDGNLINIQRSQGDRGKSLVNQSTDYSSGARPTHSEREKGGLFIVII